MIRWIMVLALGAVCGWFISQAISNWVTLSLIEEQSKVILNCIDNDNAESCNITNEY